MNTTLWEKVSEFHKAYEVFIGGIPELPEEDLSPELQHLIGRCLPPLRDLQQIPTVTTRGMRIKLLAEEVSEYLVAEVDNDLIDISDALTDIHYIAAGTEVSYGIPGEVVLEEVHDSNMRKLGPDGKPIKREDGKVLKPDGWRPPDIFTILRIFGHKK